MYAVAPWNIYFTTSSIFKDGELEVSDWAGGSSQSGYHLYAPFPDKLKDQSKKREDKHYVYQSPQGRFSEPETQSP
jgi:hypothetical protein